jgi:hypothetical protein
MKKYLKILSAVVLSLFVVTTSVRAIDEAVEAKQITKEEAEKNYPPPKGGYPTAERGNSSGFFISPYTAHKSFNCAKIPHGGYVLDPYAKKVFVRP